MSLFKKEEPKKYDIYEDKEKIDQLEREMEPYGTIHQLLQAKGFIQIKPRPNDNTFYFSVHPDHTAEVTDYFRLDVALRRRNHYKLL
jgi:hypothetical protein